MRRVCQRGVAAFGLIAALLLGTVGARGVGFNPDLIPPDFPFRIAGLQSGLCWDVAGGAFSPGKAVQQYPCHTGRNQNWTIEPKRDATSRDFVLIRNLGHPEYCVARSQRNQLVVDLCDRPETTDYIEWRLEGRRSGSFLAHHISPLRAAGCVDVPDGSDADQVSLQVYGTCHGGQNQSWLLLPSR